MKRDVKVMQSETTPQHRELLTKLVKSLADDPLLTNILISILRKPKITTKEIKKSFPQLKGTSIYYYLNNLVDNNFVQVKSEQVPNSNLIRKKYLINPNLFTEEFVEELRAGNDRNSTLMSLLIAQQIINNQIHAILQMSDTKFKQLAEGQSIKMISTFALEEHFSSGIVNKFNELYPILKTESASKLGDTFIDRIQHGDRFFFICNLPNY